MKSTINSKVIYFIKTNLFILLASIMHISYAETINLNCHVNGEILTLSGSEKYEPAELFVTIDLFKNNKYYISIDIDGPSDYQNSVYTVNNTTYHGVRILGEDVYGATMKRKDRKLETTIRINRTTGNIYLISDSELIDTGHPFQVRWNGTCSKTNKSSKF